MLWLEYSIWNHGSLKVEWNLNLSKSGYGEQWASGNQASPKSNIPLKFH